MIQRGRGLSFKSKPSQGMRILGNPLRQELEGDEAMQADILSLVHDAHPAAAKLLDNAVVRDGLPDHWKQESYVPWDRQVNESRGQGSNTTG